MRTRLLFLVMISLFALVGQTIGQISTSEELRTAIDNSASSTVLTLSKDFTFNSDYAISITNGQVITINGATNGTVINADERCGIFVVDKGASLSLNNITLKKGNGTYEGGGAIKVVDGSINLKNCTLSENISGAQGAAIIGLPGAVVNLENCIIANHRIDAQGGAIFHYGPGAITLENCLFSNNEGSNGGAVHTMSNAPLTIVNCVFTKNKSTYSGGAVVAMGNTNIINSTFRSNTAGGSAGALMASSKTLLINSIFVGNDATENEKDIRNATSMAYSAYGDAAASSASLNNIENIATSSTFINMADAGNVALRSDSKAARKGTLVGSITDEDVTTWYFKHNDEWYYLKDGAFVSSGLAFTTTDDSDNIGNPFGLTKGRIIRYGIDSNASTMQPSRIQTHTYYTAGAWLTTINPPAVEQGEDNTLVLTFPRVDEASTYEIAIYEIEDEERVLYTTIQVDESGNILRADDESLTVLLENLDPTVNYVAVINAINEDKEIVNSFETALFSTEGMVDNHNPEKLLQYYTSAGQLYIEVAQPTALRIYAVSGKLVVNRTVEVGHAAISLPRGIYILQAGKEVNKIVIE